MPSLDGFVESLIKDQEKMVQMGVLQTSKNQYILMADSTNVQNKGKHKGKDKRYIEFKPKEKLYPSYGALGSKKDKEKRFE